MREPFRSSEVVRKFAEFQCHFALSPAAARSSNAT